ncbi:MAG: SLBB domain-containing protein [Acidobacteria bacterium]|nr:SLBB domain-containing protein [Acidobacteriota bacterium]
MKKLACLLITAGLLAGQLRQPPPAAGNSDIGGANLPAQKIGANDLIAVSVYGAPELTRTVRVGADGSIRLPMLRQRLRAEGLLPAALETALIEALTSERILVDPVVTVTVVEYSSRPITVGGAVRKPVTFQAFGTVTLMNALARAEGFGPDAGPEILVSRRQAGDNGQSHTLVQRIPVKALIDAADPDLNLPLLGGEEIRVPEAGKVFVVGNVKKPGAYPVQDVSDTTVLKMLALAEGLMPYAGKQAFIYRREAGSSSKNEIPIELQRIIARRAQDVPLQANDILYIPDNKGRRMTLGALERMAGFGIATASGVLIWRR